MLNRNSGKDYFHFILVVISLHLFFFIYAVFWGNIYVGDFKEYLLQSINIKEHLNWYTGVFADPIQLDLYSRRPPGYGLFIFLIKSLYDSDYSVLFVQSVLSVLNFWGMTKLLKFFDFKFNVPLFLTIIVVLFPSQFIYANFIMSEVLFQTFLFWSFYNLVQFILFKKNKNILFYNSLLALALLTKPVLYLFWFINILFMIYLFLKYNKRISTVLTGIIPLAVVLIISFYNYKVTGYFHYSSLKHNNLLDFHANYIMINKVGFEEAEKKFKEIKTEVDSIKDYEEQSKQKESIAYGIIRENIGDYSKFYAKGLMNFFLDPGRFDFAEFFRIKSPDNVGIYYIYLEQGYKGIINYVLKLPLMFILFLLSVMVINILMIFSMINFIFEKKINPPVRIYFFLIITYICVFTGIVGALRYKLPLYQIILFSVPFFIDRILIKFSKIKAGK